MALGRPTWRLARARIQDLLSVDCADLRDNADLRARAFYDMDKVRARARNLPRQRPAALTRASPRALR